jgi:hypothetical protein
MKSKVDVIEVWSAVRNELRKLRGQNRFRGNEEHLLQRREIRLHYESRGAQMKQSIVTIHLTDRLEDLWAEGLTHVPARVAEMESGLPDLVWRKWLGLIVDECRGAVYLHTSSKGADYRQLSGTDKTKN